MSDSKTILVVGTYDTKLDELSFISECIRQAGGNVLCMDVSVLGKPGILPDYSKRDVAQAAATTIEAIIDCDDENTAMQLMARGASTLALELYAQSLFDGVIILGGSMGTDLALDVCISLPLGVPKYIVSTVAFSSMIPAERLAADTQMILWAGGLYGLNAICKASLSQAAGAVLGAARCVQLPDNAKPVIGMTSLGKSALTYMVKLKPALEQRGFEVAIFHATGMGGRAFESLAAQGAFCCVFDFCIQELGNEVHGSTITAGPSRLTAAGLAGIPQIVAPGCTDLVDLVSSQPLPKRWQNHETHVHNRLITSAVLNDDERRQVAYAVTHHLSQAMADTVFLLPLSGCGEWDREGAPLHDAQGYAAFCDQMRNHMPENVVFHEIDAHINDEAFADIALDVFDQWCADGVVKRTRHGASA
ncbi:MAG: Tm-1-like ATP-binding domain-containing protein [Granulosicoccus sp.]